MCAGRACLYACARARVQSKDKQRCDWRLRLQSKSLSIAYCLCMAVTHLPSLLADISRSVCLSVQTVLFVKVAINVPNMDALHLY